MARHRRNHIVVQFQLAEIHHLHAEVRRLRRREIARGNDLTFNEQVDNALTGSVGIRLYRRNLFMVYKTKLDELVDEIVVSCSHCCRSRFKTSESGSAVNMELARAAVNQAHPRPAG